MKTIKEIEKIILSHKQELNEKYGLISIGLFGSYVRGDQDSKSDLDVLVEVRRPMGFVKFIRLENHLSQLLGVKVDLVTKKPLSLISASEYFKRFNMSEEKKTGISKTI